MFFEIYYIGPKPSLSILDKVCIEAFKIERGIDGRTLGMAVEDAIEAVSDAAVASGSKSLILAQVVGGSVGSILCAVELIKALKEKKSKAHIIMLLLSYGVTLSIIYLLPYIVSVIKLMVG